MRTKNTIAVAVTLLLLVCATSATAQTRGRNRAPAAHPAEAVTTQTATTEDGRRVILSSNGTWRYADEGASSSNVKAPSGRKNSVLAVEAGLVYKSGDVKPVARTEFYLLDDHLGKILQQAGLEPERMSSNDGRDPAESLVFSYGLATVYSSLPDQQAFFLKAQEAIKPHIIETVTTDFGGKAQFSSVAAGTYYLMGVARTPNGMALWNLRVDMKAGQNSVTLDQNNAAYAH